MTAGSLFLLPVDPIQLSIILESYVARDPARKNVGFHPGVISRWWNLLNPAFAPRRIRHGRIGSLDRTRYILSDAGIRANRGHLFSDETEEMKLDINSPELVAQ